jgi:hypothetical protein
MEVGEALRRRPFLVVAVPLSAGIALSQPFLFWPAIAALPALGLLAARWPRSRILCWMFIGLAAGVAREEGRRLRPSTDIGRLERPVEAKVVGHVLEAPRFYSPGSGSFPLRIESVEVDGRPAPWTGDVRVQFYRAPPPLTGGEVIAVEGRLLPLQAPTNPGVFDRAAALERLGMGATLSTSRPMTVVRAPPPFRVATWTDRARSGLRGLLARHAPPEVAALQAALLFGSREELPPE